MLPDCVVTVCVGATVDRKVKQTLMRMRDEIVNENVARFFGISSHADDAAVCLVEQYCANGTLVEFLLDNEHIVDHPFRYVVCADVASGMAYLHRHDLVHGNLSTDKCHVDARWTVKVVDWEYSLYSAQLGNFFARSFGEAFLFGNGLVLRGRRRLKLQRV